MRVTSWRAFNRPGVCVCCVGLAGLAAWLGIKGETMLN